jgi:hypothetical protein
MKKVRNISPSLLKELNLEGDLESIVSHESVAPTSEFIEIAGEVKALKPKSHAPSIEPRKTLSETEELIYAAVHPGDLVRLGFEYFEHTNDVPVPAQPGTALVRVVQVPIREKDIFVFLDWRNYALKNIGGNLMPMYPGEMDNSHFDIFLGTGSGIGNAIGRYFYGPGNQGQTPIPINAIGTIDTMSTFQWPGRFRYIIEGPRVISVHIRYKAAALPPYAIPAVVASKVIGYYKQG